MRWHHIDTNYYRRTYTKVTLNSDKSDMTWVNIFLYCRFEKLDITPKSAQKLKPVLERWLAEAELWNQKGQQNLMEFVGGEPSKKRKRRTSFTPQAIEVLNTYFEKNALPTGQEITEIARELNYDREVVRVWFCNRRQTLKNTSKINVFQVHQWACATRPQSWRDRIMSHMETVLWKHAVNSSVMESMDFWGEMKEMTLELSLLKSSQNELFTYF